MTKFKIGDIVRLTKGKRGEPGFIEQVKRIGTYTDHFRYESVVALTELPTFIRTYNWTVELIERPAPPLPTKPNTLGWATVDGTRHLARLAVGQWELYDTDGSLGATPHPSTIEGFEEAVLIPKELADKVMKWADDDHSRGWLTVSIMQQIADHLKGQDDE